MLRLAAWELLSSNAPVRARELDRIAVAHELDARDRAFLAFVTATVERRLGTLRAVVKELARGKPNRDVTRFIHLGLAQLYFMDRVPDHAAVSETVMATNEALGLAKGRYMNGILRNAIRMVRPGHIDDPRCDIVDRDLHFTVPVFRDPAEGRLLWAEDALSIPAVILKGWTKEFGEECAEKMARQALHEPPLSVRVVDGDMEAALLELEELELRPYATHGSTLLFDPAATSAVVKSEAFAKGRLTIQGATAFAAADFVEAQPGESILDLCASPGGKTAVLAKAGANVTACDLDAGKLARLSNTLERLGATDRVELIESDGTASLGERQFDAALVDAPCSNTGVLAARPEARWRFGPQSQKSLQQLQARLLREAAARVKPGGRLVWSTCSLEPSENRAQVSAFLREQPEWILEVDQLATPDFDEGPTDGGFAARLRRTTG